MNNKIDSMLKIIWDRYIEYLCIMHHQDYKNKLPKIDKINYSVDSIEVSLIFTNGDIRVINISFYELLRYDLNVVFESMFIVLNIYYNPYDKNRQLGLSYVWNNDDIPSNWFYSFSERTLLVNYIIGLL